MKKIEIHVFPNKTARGKSYKFSPVKALLYILIVVSAIAGFILFSPSEIIDNINSGHVTEMHQQNVAIKKELEQIRASVDETILKAEDTKILKDSSLKRGGLGFILENSAVDENQMPPKRKSLAEVTKTFNTLLDALEKDSVLASKIPVLHPMKNGHAVRKRFGMAYDHFTDRELPHRGIDYVGSIGDTVYATGDGVVGEIQKHRGFGLTIKIDHMKGVKTFYAHLSESLVNQGNKVQRGQPIAIIGESGRESGVGLHYEIRLDGNAVDPERFFITK